VRVWRITRAAHAPLDGEGARRLGGRWNSPGVAVVFTAEHLSLAALEYLVHIDIDEVPDDLMALGIDVPEDAGELLLDAGRLPPNWRTALYSDECRSIGDAWAKSQRGLLLRVPSVIVPEEDNLIINPAHPRAEDVRIASERPFTFDPRLLGRSDLG
jgi:RES domain-containing protein